jgi:dethiobiotin synthetase
LHKIIFITGTDTGVGKTVLTALLLSHLRQTGSQAFALKPFCSGGRADAELLHALQDGDLTLEEINPFYFPEPLAPLVAARKQRRRIHLDDVLNHIQRITSSRLPIEKQKAISKNSTLLIEGAGGLLSPLGEGFNLLDLVNALTRKTISKSSIQPPASSIDLIIVAPNRLGTINHTLLTIQALKSSRIKELKVVLMDVFFPHHSTPDTRSNPSILAELISPIPLFRIPNLGKNPSKRASIRKFAKKYKKTLAEILVLGIFLLTFFVR